MHGEYQSLEFPIKNYGKVEVRGSQLLITSEPYVTIRLKRVFGKLSTHSHGTHKLHLTPETARDLDWFMERYPLEISAADRARLDEFCEKHRETEAFVNNFYQNGFIPKLPQELALPAREYQKIAAEFLWRMKGYLLADDVGVGKTVSFITALTNPELLPAVVVTLAGTMPKQWEDEIKKFAPHLKIHVAKKGTPYKFDIPDVFIINYHKLSGWAETLAKCARTIAFDECQELRRTESDKYKGASWIAQNAEYRIGLSATPIYNYGGEFYNVLNVLCPDKLGTRDEFMREWCSWGYSGKERINNPKAFGAYLRDSGIMLRRTRKDVGRELPPLQKFHITIDADNDALNKVSDRCAELARLILRGQDVNRGDTMRAAEEMSNILRQATGIAKAPYVADFVRILIENGEKVLLYGWHRAVYDIWLDQLKEFNPVMMTGSESAAAKQRSKEAFMNDESKVLIMSLRAGAGIDGLQYCGCKTTVFGELDWASGVLEQAIGRIDRDGQPDPVCAYFLIAETGSDPVMVGRARHQEKPARRRAESRNAVI
jgi:SNF2 family DNA or RNA helicase